MSAADTPDLSVCCCKKLIDERHYSGRDMSCCFGTLYSRNDARLLLSQCESSLQYVTGKLSKVKVFGKMHDIPRKQVRERARNKYVPGLYIFFFKQKSSDYQS